MTPPILTPEHVSPNPLPGAAGAPGDHDDIVFPQIIPFLCVHLACFAAIWTGVTWEALALAILFYWLRMFAIGAGYHRYFSHKSFATGRIFQFLLAFLAQSTAQKSVIWWASKHRHHHRWSDTPKDVHSPRQKGFLFSHVGWIFLRRHDTADMEAVSDLTVFPELMWLHKFEVLPAVALAGLCFLLAGWSGLIVGFCWSTVAVYHATFCINSLAHVHGSKRYVTGDDSRNNVILAFFTMGEGWHNNHHAFQSCARQGFFWWEIDPTYYVLRGLAFVGIVRDMREPPQSVLQKRYHLGGRVIDRAASDLAETFDVARIVATLRANTPDFAALRARITAAQSDAAEILAQLRLAHVPTRDEVRQRARAMFVDTRSFEDIVERAHAKILETLGAGIVAA